MDDSGVVCKILVAGSVATVVSNGNGRKIVREILVEGHVVTVVLEDGVDRLRFYARMQKTKAGTEIEVIELDDGLAFWREVEAWGGVPR
jgi:hypothetical protein